MEYKEIIIDAKTGEITERAYSEKEILEIEKAEKIRLEKIAKYEKEQSIRQSALAKLAALGLTEDEIAAL